ncbi:MAG: hypothetical protein AAFP04_03700 [Myxococcota bacterium]
MSIRTRHDLIRRAPRYAFIGGMLTALGFIGCSRTPEPIPAPSDVVENPAEEPEEAPPSKPVQARRKPTRAVASEAPSQDGSEDSSDEMLASTPTTVDPSPPVNRSNRCVVGSVRAQGEIVVPINNAVVTLLRGDELLGETRTDENGKFAWCAGPKLQGENFEMTVRVSKEPFQSVSQQRAWKVGTQEEFDFALVAPQF